MDIALDIASVRTVRGSPSRVHVLAPRRRRAGHQGCRREHLTDVEPPAPSPPEDGAWFGATVSLDSRQTPSTFDALQRKLGRVLDIDRDYSNFSRVQPSAQVKWDVANHVIPFLSIDPRTSTGKQIPWSSIANGSYDSVIKAQADGLASLGSPVLLSFDHEPDHNTGARAPANFVAAWKHYVTVFRDQGATNVQFVLVLMAQTYGQASIAEWYPGDAYVDWVGADGYNSFGCYGGPGAWQDFSTIFSAFNAFAVAHDKPAVVAEWGSVEDPATPGRKAQWITDAAQTIESWPQIKAASYFDGFGRSGTCKRGLGTSASALTAFKNMSALPYFNPRPTAAITANPVKGPAPLTVTFDASGSTGELNPISSWQLAFGDGSTPASGTGAPPASITHTYATGTYTATLEVADATGQYQVQTSGRIAADPPPTVHTGLSSDRTTSGVTLSGGVNPTGSILCITSNGGRRRPSDPSRRP